MTDMTTIPPRPKDWTKTFADLDAEYKSGSRQTLGSPETDWARDYERSLLPSDTRFPLVGDIYEALEDLETFYQTSWNAAFTGGGRGKILKGDRIIVRFMLPQPVAVSADALNYHEVEERMVPEGERKAIDYGGFRITLRTADLNEKFRLIRENANLNLSEDIS
jgi:hypothetical protein